MEKNFDVSGERAGLDNKQANMLKQLEGSLEDLVKNGC
jgi:hypothetical protein